MSTGKVRKRSGGKIVYGFHNEYYIKIFYLVLRTGLEHFYQWGSYITYFLKQTISIEFFKVLGLNFFDKLWSKVFKFDSNNSHWFSDFGENDPVFRILGDILYDYIDKTFTLKM